MRRGNSDDRSTTIAITTTLWKERKGILILSSFHWTNVSSVTRMKRDGTYENITCPQIVKKYNLNMGFVVKADIL
jgi:hypothetical protein